MYDVTVSPHLQFNTRGNSYKLLNHAFRYDLRKHFFSARELCNTVLGFCTHFKLSVVQTHVHGDARSTETAQ